MSGGLGAVLGRAALVATTLGAACSPVRDGGIDIPPSVKDKVLDKVPEGVQHTFVDFGGKVRLVGVDISAPEPAKPGDVVDVKLYWKAVETLSDGWRLFTHLVNDRGLIVGNYDTEGPLRQLDGEQQPALPPSAWAVGPVYLDEQKIEIPAPGPRRPMTDRVMLVTGLWRGKTRLDVRGGTHLDNAAVVAHFRTGIGAPTTPGQTP